MSRSETSEELTNNIERLLEKHEIHNRVLACELSIFVIQRERTALKQGHRITEHSLNKAFSKGAK